MKISTREVWKPILLSPYCRVSNLGNVRCANGSPIDVKVQQGYRWITITMPYGQRRRHKIAWLVLEAFVGPRPTGQVSRHLNDVHTDDRLANLAWGTHSDNTADKMRNGHFKPGPGRQKGDYSPTVETRRKQSEALRGKAFTPEHRANLAAANRARSPLVDKGEEIAAKFTAGAPLKDLAKEYRVSVITLSKWLRRTLGKKIDGRSHRKIYPNKLDSKLEAIVEAYEAGQTQAEIAQTYGVSQRAIGVRLQKLNRTMDRSKLSGKTDEIVKAYKAGRTLSDIARDHGVTPAAIWSRLKKVGEH